ncbi:glucosamine-6-phosphate deaminase [candidate division KSB1 bacterium]|jgi:glucosamine-6-phosphate deaminase|nr:glucosamine-6-phosphate deaminase [candidate division KSB1 bacterium]
MEPFKSFQVEKLEVEIYQNKTLGGKAAAEWVTAQLQEAIDTRNEANLILSMGASQFEFLDALANHDNLEWSKIRVFHLDEYKGISIDHPASLAKNLKERMLDKVHPKQIWFLNGQAQNLEKEMNEYAEKLTQYPADVACIGIGENGHLAFNDPPVADFVDPELVKLVELDKTCRMQQVGEGWFESLNEVPTLALSLTIPAIMRSENLSCVVPDKRKANAVAAALYGPITTDCPASILRTHDHAILFLDPGSAGKI